MASSPRKDDRRTIFGWCVYDWANSAYATTILAGLLPAYFAGVVVGEEGVTLFGSHYRATSLWGFATAFATATAFLMAPILGATADFSAAKKKFLLTFAYTGCLFVILLFFSQAGDVLMTLALFMIAHVAFVSANVYYDAFLPQIVREDRLDQVSGWGYAAGYVGGALHFFVAILLITFHESLGMTQGMAARIGLGSTGLWWGGFTLITAFSLREPPPREALPERYRRWPRPIAFTAVGLQRTLATTKRVSRFRHLLLFLIAFMLYNDGIQTVIVMATVFGKDELKLETSHLMITLLVIQFVAMAGSLIFGKLAGWIGTKRAIMLSLVLWTGIVIYAYFIDSVYEYFALGMMVGLVLGGSQALSRSYYSAMIPPEAGAEFFGFYTVFSKFAAIWGPLTFALIDKITGSTRLSIAALAVFFIAGLVLLALVNETKAKEARNAGLFDHKTP